MQQSCMHCFRAMYGIGIPWRGVVGVSRDGSAFGNVRGTFSCSTCSCDLSHHELLARQLVLANICSGTWSWQLIIAIYPISYCPLAVCRHPWHHACWWVIGGISGASSVLRFVPSHVVGTPFINSSVKKRQYVVSYGNTFTDSASSAIIREGLTLWHEINPPDPGVTLLSTSEHTCGRGVTNQVKSNMSAAMDWLVRHHKNWMECDSGTKFRAKQHVGAPLLGLGSVNKRCKKLRGSIGAVDWCWSCQIVLWFIHATSSFHSIMIGKCCQVGCWALQKKTNHWLTDIQKTHTPQFSFCVSVVCVDWWSPWPFDQQKVPLFFEDKCMESSSKIDHCIWKQRQATALTHCRMSIAVFLFPCLAVPSKPSQREQTIN